MPRRRRRLPNYPASVIDGLDASRRVGWAKYYGEAERADQLQVLNDVFRDRVETLVPITLALVNSVLHERNVDAFARAWKVQQVIDQFHAGRRR